jgi:ABC-type Na+ efflux pump permease subunit
VNSIFVIFKHEFRAFVKSGVSSILLLLFTSLAWGGVIAGKIDSIDSVTSYLWVIFFALVASAGVSSNSFVRERLSSTMEILVISGVSRTKILLGKLLFTTLTTLLVGWLALTVSIIVALSLYGSYSIGLMNIISATALYSSSAILVTTLSAFLSIALSNPRAVQFINFGVLSLISTLFSILTIYYPITIFHLVALILLLAIIFLFLAMKIFNSEKIIQPLIY